MPQPILIDKEAFICWHDYVLRFSDQPGSASCVAMSDDDNGLWFDEDCGTLYGAICEKQSSTETQPPTEITPPASGGCAPGWVEYGQYCYLVSTKIWFPNVCGTPT